MMVTTRLGYGCAAADAADARRPKNASTTPKTRRIEFPFQLNEERSLRPRDHGQQEIRHRARAEVERIAAVENRGWAVVRIGVRERADALHRIGRIGKPGIAAVIFIVLAADGERDTVAAG